MGALSPSFINFFPHCAPERTIHHSTEVSQDCHLYNFDDEAVDPSPAPLGLSCTDSNFALAAANVETQMIGSSLAHTCWQQGQTAVFSRLWLLVPTVQMQEEAYPDFVEVSLFMSLCSDKEYCT